MAIKQSRYIWFNGKLVPWDQAQVHVLSHALHYGSSVFEGIRVYPTPDGSRAFRLTDHVRRLFDSARIHRIVIPWTLDDLVDACRQVVTENALDNGAYIRPVSFRGYGEIGLAAKPDHRIDTAIAAWEWGAYLGADAMEQGVDVCVSSWQRVAPNTIPALSKAGGNYISSQLISLEAKRLGFAEGIALTTRGTISEGAGENVFIIKNGQLFTPTATDSILTGITRDTLITLARAEGLEVIEKELPREMLYLADEIFFTGTAAEVTPVRSVDRLEVGDGTRGPITKMLQERFFGLFKGQTEDRWGWLEPVTPDATRQSAAR